ncbi:membrane protein [Virgibacillus natechei]|uniref:Membrane protein n=1 Tax=Virgibacillus natechei TaxID=1216297 RepID=A0ABS4II73_9BACI|nr:YihY/virulence factor BrkB family protein [Virgibacillus natechei]MBP1970620.1 membrane protein [Virgibacillus natechei]UZD13990.1 YihY/virulence factor BrkB family protein [Virgibacillus natechei]
MKQVIDFVKQVYQKVMNDDIMGLAAQLSYFFLLSLFPLLIFLLTLVGYLPIEEQRVLGLIADYAPAQIMDLINTNISELLNQQHGGLLSIGIIGTLWSASNAIKALTKAFNKGYEVVEDRSFIVSRLIAIAMTIGMVLVLCIALLLPVFGRVIGEYIFSFFGLSEGFITVWEGLRWLVSSIIFYIVFLTLYKIAPNVRIYFRNAIWGALFATISWQVVSLGFSFYVNNMGNFSATYGSLGAFIVLMIWLYISGIVIMTGGVINAVIKENKQK